MDVNYENLFAAIYQLAVKDDFETVCGRLAWELTAEGADISEAKMYIDKRKDYIKRRVQENVYQEAMEWGSGESRKIQRDNINTLVAEVIDEYKRENKLPQTV